MAPQSPSSTCLTRNGCLRRQVIMHGWPPHWRGERGSFTWTDPTEESYLAVRVGLGAPISVGHYRRPNPILRRRVSQARLRCSWFLVFFLHCSLSGFERIMRDSGSRVHDQLESVARSSLRIVNEIAGRGGIHPFLFCFSQLRSQIPSLRSFLKCDEADNFPHLRVG